MRYQLQGWLCGQRTGRNGVCGVRAISGLTKQDFRSLSLSSLTQSRQLLMSLWLGGQTRRAIAPSETPIMAFLSPLMVPQHNKFHTQSPLIFCCSVLRFFDVGHFLKKVFIEFVTIVLLFRILVFWPRGTWDITSLTKD